MFINITNLLPLYSHWDRVGSGHRVNCYRVGSGLGSILLTRFQLCFTVLHIHTCTTIFTRSSSLSALF